MNWNIFLIIEIESYSLTYGGEDPAEKPDNEAHPDAVSLPENPLGWDEDPRSDHAADDDGRATNQPDLPFHPQLCH